MNKLKKHGIYYDSRIKLLLILLTSALAFALGGGLTGLLLFGVVSLFALLSGLWKTSIKFAIVYIVLLMLAQVLPIHLSSVITFFLLRILTIALALNILFQTTEISELIAALQASHIPQVIVISVAIILRFLPSLKQDVLYIKQGMKTRGVGLSFWRIISHPAQTYEGFLIPILMRLLMTATELSASAETRGISYPCEKTHYIFIDRYACSFCGCHMDIVPINIIILRRIYFMQTENKKGFQVKDLIVTALLSLCALVIYILCAFLSFSPYTMLVVSPLWALLAAITYFLVAAKTKKPWALFIFCAVTGIYGFYPPMIICCLIAGIISALIAWKTGCTNGKTLTISYIIYMILAAFSGTYIPFLFFSKQTLEQYAGMFGESYLGILQTLVSPVTAIIMLVVVAICAFIGALIAKKLLKKHFKKAGMV